MNADRDIVKSLGTVGSAFFGGFRKLREVQRSTIPLIHAGKNVLVASATASGKTEAIMAPLVARTLAGGTAVGSPRVRLLLVAPTRALVNDLTARLEAHLARLNLTCGRQTSDHRDKHKTPFVLVTTPESFDSMLVRDARREGGRVVDHLLAGVVAVFIDEAHLFDGTTRGDQLCWLLGRLRRLRRLNGDGEASNSSALQVCAGSATVSDPEGLASRLLGPDAVALRVPGTREIEVFGPSEAPAWFSLEASIELNMLRDRLEIVPSPELAEGAERRIWEALSSDSDGNMRKALVFVPSRRLSDTLSSHLAGTLTRRRQLEVVAHHGSLTRERRENAENTFSRARDAVLVATTTLEVGIDIGDVDLVTLVGAPPGTRSLLQRIGRAGRRIGRTRVLALPRTEVEQAALASMLISARDGALEPERYGRRWSVCVQQAASFVAQGRPRGRKRGDLVDLARDVWPEESAGTADAIIGSLLDAEHLVENRGRLSLGETWADTFDEGGRGMHANFDSSGGGIPVVDASTGETLTHVAQRPEGNQDLALGGQRWDVQEASGGEILLKPKGTGRIRGGFRYAARSAPTGLEYAVHVRRGLGLGEFDAPILDLPGGLIWLHFGGSGYQVLLCDLLPELHPIGVMAGLSVAGSPTDTALGELAMRESTLRQTIDNRFEDLERVLSVGPYQRYLPSECRRRVVAELIDVRALRHWLETRRVWQMTSDHPGWRHVTATLLGRSQ